MFLKTLCTILFFTSLAVAQGATTKLNGLEQRKNQDLTAQIAMDTARVASLSKQIEKLQAAPVPSKAKEAKAQADKLAQAQKDLPIAQKQQVSHQAQLDDFQTKTLASHQRKAKK
jgi:hypothetical protein